MCIALLSAGCGVSRNSAYFVLLDKYRTAEPREPMPAWDFSVPVAGGSASVRIFGNVGLDAIRVHYSDEEQPRTLYKYVDYSNPRGVRVQSGVLYVFWSEELFTTKSYVLAYDLEARKVLEKRRVDPKDVPES